MKKKIVCLFFIVLFLFVTALPVFAIESEGAADRQYSDVLEDLCKDEDFKANHTTRYVKKTEDEDKTLILIQVAESDHGELYLYFYRPAYEVFDPDLTSVSLWTEYSVTGEDFIPVNYDLEKVSENGVFVKYLVKGFSVSSDAYRYYNISQVHRQFVNGYDELQEGADRVEKAIGIGQQWCAHTQDGVVSYEKNTFEVLELDVNHTGYLYLEEGFTFGSFFGVDQKKDLHYIAFSGKDIDIDKIFDADLSYRSQYRYEKTETFQEDVNEYGSILDNSVFLSDTQSVTWQGEGLAAREYSWDRIMSATSFVEQMENVNEIDFSEASKAAILESDWVFAFAETDRTYTATSTDQATIQIVKTTKTYTKVSSVSILRVHFQNVSGVYNLATVADKITADDVVDGVSKGVDMEVISEWFQKIFQIVGIILLLVVILFLWKPISLVLKILFAPLKLLFRFAFRRRERRRARRNSRRR